MFKRSVFASIAIYMMLSLACSHSRSNANIQPPTAQMPPPQSPVATPTPSPFPNLQAELLSDKDKTTQSPLGKFDFKNYTYTLPRGWQNPDGSDEMTLVNGKAAPYAGKVRSEEHTSELQSH